MDLSTQQLQIILQCAVEIGALAAYCDEGLIKPYIKKSEAYTIYGRKNVEKWIESGFVTIYKDGEYSAAVRINRLEIEIISNNYVDYAVFVRYCIIYLSLKLVITHSWDIMLRGLL